jgi:Protein of unknown function (DUF2848)
LSSAPTTATSPATAVFDPATITHLALAGWAGRNQAAVEAHIRELEELGMPRPSRTPIFYRAAASLVTTATAIQVVGVETSGEVEFVVVPQTDGLWIGLGSDHTDRALETTSVALSKQMCAKVVAPTLWRFDDLAPHWDSIELKSWAHRGGAREIYQEGTLASILPVSELVSRYAKDGEALGVGGMLFSGTIATVHQVGPADEFEMQLSDPALSRRISHRYRIETLPVNS